MPKFNKFEAFLLGGGILSVFLHINRYSLSLARGQSMSPIINGGYDKSELFYKPPSLKKYNIKIPTWRWLYNILFADIIVIKNVKQNSVFPSATKNSLIREKDLLIINGVTFRRGDIVTCHRLNHQIVKRLIALDGDIIPIDSFFDTTRNSNNSSFYALISPENIWLEGDNSIKSVDSRNYGEVPVKHVTGKAVFKLWPLNSQFGPIRSTLEISQDKVCRDSDHLDPNSDSLIFYKSSSGESLVLHLPKRFSSISKISFSPFLIQNKIK